MGRVSRIDRGTLGELETTPQGGLAIPAFLTRTGVFEYDQPDGSVVREYRPPEEVFHKDALATLPNATLTNEHPSEHVDPENFRKHVVGHVEKDVRQDGDKITARLIVQDKRTLNDIKKHRKREVSCGYHCDTDDTPGVTADGERYDRVQRNIRYNHVALVDAGRAGPDVRLRLDTAGNSKEQGMKIEIIGGVEYECDTAPHKAAVSRRDAARKQRADEAAKVKSDRDKQAARADAAEAEAKKLKEQLVEATSTARLDHAVRVRGAVIRRAQSACGANFKTDGLSNLQIKVAAVKKAFPQIKLDGKSKDYVEGLFRSIPAGDERRDGAPRSIPDHLRQPPPRELRGDAQGGMTLEQIKRRADRDADERHRRPLAVSKSNSSRDIDNFPTIQGSQLETMR